MKQKGEITVFLSLCLLSVTALICVMIESARTAGSRYYFQSAVNGALDNLYSQYHRKLWQKYRILGLPYESEYEITQRLSAGIQKYLDVENWYPVTLDTVELSECCRLTDQGGDYLTREILDYMLYGIWDDLAILPENGTQFLKDVREAAGAGTMTDAYDGHEREVRKLEQAVENLVECVKKQETYAAGIAGELGNNDPSGFRRQAREFYREEQKMDSLVRAYEQQAQKLKDRISGGHNQLDEVKQELQENRPALFEEQMNPYDAYISQDGGRKQEIQNQLAAGHRNRDLLNQVESLVEELEEEYEARQDDDTEDDVLSLSPAASLWGSFTHSVWNLSERHGDKQKQGFLDRVKQMAQGNLLELVLPEGEEISAAALPAAEFPSRRINGSSGHSLNPAERVLIHEYCGNFFLNAVSGEKRPVQYEMEYLLNGGPSDRENLENAVTRLLLIRQGLNLIHILSDSGKRQEAKTLALTITGATGIAPLVEITACFIMGIWAVAEAVADLRALFSGGKVPLWKTREDWQLSLEGVLKIGEENRFSEEKDREKGLTYEDYLKLMLFLTEAEDLQMRMLDMMEMNIRREETGFLVDYCAYKVDICGKACGKHVFFELPIVENLIGQSEGYPLEAPAWRTY